MNISFNRASSIGRLVLLLVLSMSATPSIAQVTLTIEPETLDTQSRPEVVYFIVELSEPATLLEHPTIPQALEHEFIGESNPNYPANLADNLFIDVPQQIDADTWRVPVLAFGQLDGEAVFRLWLVGSFQVEDAVGNTFLVEAVRSGNPALIDMTANSVSSLSYAGAPSVNGPFDLQADFSTPVTDFAVEDLELSNASASNFVEITAGEQYEFQVNPTAEGEVAVTIPYGAAFDANLDLTGRSNTVRVQFDTTPPVIIGVTNTLASSPTNVSEFTLLFEVSEPLDSSSLATAMAASISSTGGLNSEAISDGLDADDRHVVRVFSELGEGTISFAALPAGAVSDVAGNATVTGPTAMPADVQVDRIAPMVTVDFSTVDGGNVIVSGSAISASEVTAGFAFSETVGGLEASDFVVDWSGATAPAAGVLSMEGDKASYRVGDIQGDGDLTIRLVDAAASDTAGNASPPASLDLVISNVPIVANIQSSRSIVYSSPGLEDLDFTISWPKRVTDIDLADLSIVTTGSVTVADDVLQIISQDHNPERSIVQVALQAEIEGVGTLQLQVAAGAVMDDFGNTSSVASSSSPPTPVNEAQIDAGPFTFSGYDSIVMNELATDFTELSGSRIDFNGFELTPRAGQTVATVNFDRLTGELTFDGAMRLGPDGELFAEDSALLLDVFDTGTGFLTLKKAPFDFDVVSGNVDLLGATRQILGVDFSLDGMALTVAVRLGSGATSIVLPGVTITQQGGGFVKTLPTTARDKVLILAENWRNRAGTVLPINAFTPVTGGHDLSVSVDTNSALYDGGIESQLTGRVALRGAQPPSFEDFVLTVAGFDFRPLFVTAITPTDGPGYLQLSLLSYSAGGIEADLNDIELRIGDELVGGDQLTLETTSFDPLAELTGVRYQSDRIYTPSAQILVGRGDPTRVEWLSTSPGRLELPLGHVIRLGGGADGQTFEIGGPGGAYIDVEGYHASSLEVPSNFGPFSYVNVTIYHDGRTSTGEQVDGPSVGVDSGGFAFDIGGLPFANMSMPFRINNAFDQLRFTGDISLPGDFKLHTLLKADGVFARTSSEIQISADSLTSFDSCVPDEDGDAPIPSMNLAVVPPFCLRFSNEVGEQPTWQGMLKTKLPVRSSGGNVLELEGSGEIISGRWNSISATIGGFEKPIGTTGAFLASLGGGLDNLARVESCWVDTSTLRRVCGVKPVTIIGNALITSGPEIKFIPSPTRLLQGPVEVRITDTRADADGTLRLFDPEGPELGDAFVDVIYSPLSFAAGSDVTGYPGVTGKTRINGGTSADGTLYASGESTWGFEIPEDVPLVGGLSIAAVTMTLNTSPRVSMKGTFSVVGIGAFAVELTTAPSLSFSGKSPLRPWERELVYRVDAGGKHQEVGEVDSDPAYYRFLGNFDSAFKTYRMPGSKAASTVELSSTAPTLIRVSYERAGVAAEVEIFGPDGTRYAPSTVETDPTRAAPVGLLSTPAASNLAYVFRAPKAGTYRVEIANPAELGEVAVEALVKNASPTFNFTQVASSGTQLELAWQAGDADGEDADITLFIDQNRTGANGWALELGRTIATGNSTVIDLSTLSLPPGNYWVYAQIDDAVNPPTTVYADSPVFVANPDAPAAVRGVSVAVSESTALVSWKGSSDPTISGYSVKWTSALDDPFYGSAISVEPGVETAFIEGLLPDTTYRFTVVAYRQGADVKTRSSKLAAIAAAARGEPIDAGELSLSDHEQIAALSASLDQQAVPASEVEARLASADSRAKGVFMASPALIVEGAPLEIALVTTKSIPFENNPPRFLSDPPGVLPVDTALVYPVEVADSDGDPVTLSVVTGPAGMQVVGTELRWDGTTDGGFVEIELSATDGTDSTTQAWTLVVADAFADQLRLSTAQPPVAEPGTPWEFAVAPQGGCAAPISYELFNAAEGMTIDANGQLQWSVPGGAADDVQFTVLASQTCEGTAASASQQYFVDVRPPQDTTLVPFPAGCAAPPTAVVSGPVQLPDNGGLAIQVDMSGQGPWKLVWSDGVLDENITTSPYFRPVSEPIDLSVFAFADAECAGNISVEGDLGRYAVGGTVTGLKLPYLVLELNEQQRLLFDRDGSYQFIPGLPDATDYMMTAPIQPKDHECEISNASGRINGDDVSGVNVLCTSDISFSGSFETLLEEPIRVD